MSKPWESPGFSRGGAVKTLHGTLAAPFPYFGGKSGACETVWDALGQVENYVEPFAGSSIMVQAEGDDSASFIVMPMRV